MGNSVNKNKEEKMLRRLIKIVKGEQKGITGLETAIILIAFVVVAAVFAYTVLSAGLFATQKSQEAVYSGLESTQATLELKGDVIALAGSDTTTSVAELTFTLTPVTGGEPLDCTDPTVSGSSDGLALSGASATNKITITYIDQYQKVENLMWTHSALGNADSDNLLESGEKFQITIGTGLADAGYNLISGLGTDLTAYHTFTIQIKTAKGAVLSFERTIPATLDTVTNLH
jgi:archaeal flagellin FlaB